MNNKGEFKIGELLMVAIVIIVGLVIFTGGISPNIGTLTNTRSLTNDTVAVGAATTTTILSGQAARGFVAINETGGQVVPATNYTITSYQINEDTGVIQAELLINEGLYESTGWNVSYTFEPLGYIKESGGRNLAAIISILVAVALIAIAIIPSMRSGVMDMAKGR